MNRTEIVLSKEDPVMLRELDQMEDDQIDTTDIPEVLDVRNPRRGAYHQPVQKEITVTLDEDIIHWLQSQPAGQDGLNTCIRNILRAQMNQEAADQAKQR